MVERLGFGGDTELLEPVIAYMSGTKEATEMDGLSLAPDCQPESEMLVFCSW